MLTREKEVDLAQSIAESDHSRQFDKAGAPYIEHVRRVADTVREWFALSADWRAVTAIAWLHDVVEDSERNLYDLVSLGFSADVVSGVDACTRRQGEDYQEFVERAAQDALGYWVKLADIQDHLTKREEDTFVLPESMRKRYEKAHKYLVFRVAGFLL